MTNDPSRKNYNFLSGKNIVLLIYLLLATVLAPYHRHSIHLSDTLEYLVIAGQYANGNFEGAVNSFWSPLFSWLLAIPLKAGIDPFIAIQLLQIVTGLWGLWGLLSLTQPASSNRLMELVFHTAYALLFLSFAVLVATPDLLLLSFSIWLLVYLSKENFYYGNKFSFIIFGLLGALLYFSKAAGFVFFLLAFSLVTVLHFLKHRDKRRLILIRYQSSVSVFLAVSAVWIYAISSKEGSLMFSSAPAYNLKIIGPASNPDVWGELHHPHEWKGLLPPSRPHSLNAWEDPPLLEPADWSPLHSKQEAMHYLKVVVRNLGSLQSYYFGMDCGTILLAGLAFLFLRHREAFKTVLTENRTPILAALACTLPYIPVLITERYVWINYVVLGLIAVSVSRHLYSINRNIYTAFVLLFAWSIAYKPIMEMFVDHRDYKAIFAESNSMDEFISGNTASLQTAGETAGENYTKSSLINYLTGCKYYGMIAVPGQATKLTEELRKHDISYLLCWNFTTTPDSLAEEIRIYKESAVKILKLKNKGE